MKILFLCTSLAGGGAEKLLSELLPIFKIKYNVTCELLILTDKNEKYLDLMHKNNIKVYVVNSKSHMYRIRYILRIIRNGGYDIVHANLFPCIYYCAVLHFIMPDFPFLVMTEHNSDNRRRHIKILRPLEKWIYHSYDRVICISKGTQKNLMKWLGKRRDGEKFSVIYNGINTSVFTDAQKISITKIVPTVSVENYILCMVGSFTEQKNHSFMLKVLDSLPENYELVLLGEGELKGSIINRISELGIENRVHLLGYRSDVLEIMKSSHLVVIPSKWEGFGLIAAEAMACGTPVVASDVDGLREVIDQAGIKVDPVDAKTFVNAIRCFENREYWIEYSKKGKKRAEFFTIEKMSDSYINLYNEIIASRV